MEMGEDQIPAVEVEEETTPEAVEEETPSEAVEEETTPEAVEEETTPEAVEEQAAEAGEHLPDDVYDFKSLSRGDILEGRVVRVSPEEILIDVGRKYEGTISSRELESLGPAAIENIQVGDEVLTYVVNPEDKNGRIVLSLRQADLEKEWRSFENLFETGEIFEGTVTGHNKGGLIVQLGQVRGFVPSSQLVRLPRWDEERNLTHEERRAKMIGRKLMLKIIEADRQRNRLILSERAASRMWRKEQKKQLLASLKEGDICRGRVSSLCDFGAFVDLGGADGLIHLSEISWGRVSHSKEVLQVGEEVEVYVMNVNREKSRIGLSLKHLQSDPWSQVEGKYSEGQLVEGTITKLTEFGAFAQLKGDVIEGLIHVSELSNDRIAHPKEVVKEGDTLTLRIIRLDPRRRRMGLSLKSVAAAEYADLDWQAEQEALLAEVKAEAGGEAEGKEEEELPQMESEESQAVAAEEEPLQVESEESQAVAAEEEPPKVESEESQVVAAEEELPKVESEESQAVAEEEPPQVESEESQVVAAAEEPPKVESEESQAVAAAEEEPPQVESEESQAVAVEEEAAEPPQVESEESQVVAEAEELPKVESEESEEAKIPEDVSAPASEVL